MRKLTIAFVALALVSGCTTKHYIAADYPKYLANNKGESKLPTTSAASKYALTPATMAQHFEFRSAMAGRNNLWIVEFGQLLEATLQSADVQTAFGHLTKSGLDDPGDGLLVFDVQDYRYEDMHAYVTLKVSRRAGGAEVFNRIYKAEGDPQGGKTFWGGATLMKNAVQQSTKTAIDTILRNLISDLNAPATKQASSSPR